MKTSRTILLACVWMTVCLTSGAMADDAKSASGAAANKPVQIVGATIGIPFSIKLDESKNCGMIKNLDQVILLVKGMDTGLHPLGWDPATDELAFAIKKADVTATPATNAAWQTILGSPWKDTKSDFKRVLNFTVTMPADSSVAQKLSSGKLSLLIASLGFGLVGIGLVAALWFALAYLGRMSGMLRDAGTGNNLAARTYSLGRVQMTWWFGIIMGAYIFLWAITKDVPTLSSQALLLMGISGVTGLTSAGLDASRQNQSSLTKGHFLEDLLTDADGVTLHRFQMLAMTVILGVMFIVQVATTLTMPEFDGSLLVLMGIAGGTYIGFKIPEKHADQAGAAAPATVAAMTEQHKTGYTPEP